MVTMSHNESQRLKK